MLRAQVSKSLREAGYRRSGRTHWHRLDGEWLSIIDLGPVGGQSGVAPFVGLRHDGVEDLCASLLGLPTDPFVATVGENIGCLLGGSYRAWDGGASVEEVLGHIALARAVLEPYRSLSRLSGAWSITGMHAPGAWYTYTCVALLLGEHEEARRRLDGAREAYCQRDDEVADQYKAFAARVQTWLRGASGRITMQ